MVAGQVPEFELHSIIAKLSIIFEKILKYSKFQISAEGNYLYIINPQNLKTIAKQAFVYKEI